MYYGLINSMNRVLPSNTLWNSLTSYYTADNTPNDAKGSNNGTLINGATYATGKINNSFSLDGVNDYVSLPNNSFNYSGDFSVSFWMKTSNVVPYKVLMSNFNYLGADLFYGWVIAHTASSIQIELYNGTSTIPNLKSVEFTIASNTWHNVILVRKGSLGSSIYIDNVLKASNTNTNNPTYPATANARIGCEGHGTSNNYYFYNGLIDEVGVWNRALTTTEITELYNAGAGKQYPL